MSDASEPVVCSGCHGTFTPGAPQVVCPNCGTQPSVGVTGSAGQGDRAGVRIACPLCLGPVTLYADGGGACAEGDTFDSAALRDHMQDRAGQALWAAIRSLEEVAAWVRVRQQGGHPITREDQRTQDYVEALREIAGNRASGVDPYGEQPADDQPAPDHSATDPVRRR
jgi:hypothetical protein